MALQHPYITPQQYLKWEQEAETKSEYYDGVILAMAGTSPAHDTITANFAGEFYAQIKGGPCRSNTADMRVGVRACNRYFYPDISVTCGERQYERLANAQSLLNPTLIVEVLSPSTEHIDRDDKLHCYRTLDSLVTYALVSQNTPRVETYTRQANGTWLYAEIVGLDAVLVLPAVNARICLADIYADVVFTPSAPVENRSDSLPDMEA